MEIGTKLKHKPTGKIVEIVSHKEPLSKGYALGLGKEAYEKGITVKQENGSYNYFLNNNIKKYLEEVQ